MCWFLICRIILSSRCPMASVVLTPAYVDTRRPAGAFLGARTKKASYFLEQSTAGYVCGILLIRHCTYENLLVSSPCVRSRTHMG
mmetsp:Transcript_10463/g.17101  ORF Transcript_10463/g.17101 Transcript_10463/m.17101 type:complete len:85 (+) Transcript_10463:142-396(+)